MIGCEFCRMEDNGDFGGDLKPLMILNMGWKPDSPAKTVTMASRRSTAFLVTQLMEITVMRDALNICFNGEYEFERKIRFCPMCGRELMKNDCT